MGTILKHDTPLSQYKRTKIIATVGPSTSSYQAIYDLIAAGVNGLRLNFSHGTFEEKHQQIVWIRKASKELLKPVSIIQDLQGPKMRLGDFEGVIEVKSGQTIRLGYKADYSVNRVIPTQFDLAKKVKRGERIYIYDGKVRGRVDAIVDGNVHLKIENDGLLIKRKGINLPDTDFKGDIITAKDRSDLVFGSTEDIDYVALSFVQSANDISELRRLLNSLNMPAQIIAKFETKAAIDNMQEIIAETDCVMVARGDLAYEVLPEAVPTLQNQLIGLSRRYAKPVIIATQMLFSMTTSAEPTRAEISDIASASNNGADCLMLSDETATGNYPIESVKVMKKTILYSEAHNFQRVEFPDFIDNSNQAIISRTIVDLAESLDASAIVAETKSGATARQIAAKRTTRPIIAVTNDRRTAQQLAIVYGVKSFLRPIDKLAVSKLTDWLQKQKILTSGELVVTASGKQPGIVGTTDTIKVRLLD
ncbi:MAG: pyruvate kinase [Candidatus Saccharimonadales bacterium]